MKNIVANSGILTTGLLLSVMLISSACAQQSNSEKQRQGPPPEAFTACESKSSGATCSVNTPHGTLSGTCSDPKGEGKLICAPEGGKGGRPPRQ